MYGAGERARVFQVFGIKHHDIGIFRLAQLAQRQPKFLERFDFELDARPTIPGKVGIDRVERMPIPHDNRDFEVDAANSTHRDSIPARLSVSGPA